MYIFQDGWGTGIRTPIFGIKTRRAAVTPFPISKQNRLYPKKFANRNIKKSANIKLMDEQGLAQELIKGKVMTKSQFTEKVVRLKIKNMDQANFEYKAGQYILLKVWSSQLIPIYIFKYDADIHAFEIAVNISKGDDGSNFIKSIGVGDDVEYTAPLGNLLLDATAKDIYFISEGTFVSPLIAFLYHLDKSTFRPTLSLFWGVKDEKELYLVNTIYAFSTSMPNFSYTIFISEGTSVVTHRPGRVIDAVQNADFTEGALFYVCGEDTMVGEVTAVLKSKGIDGAKILSEKPKPVDLNTVE